MSFCALKTGSSSKPSNLNEIMLSLRQCWNSSATRYIAFLLLGIYVLCAYYLYLDNLYLVDEVLDVGGPREFTISEQLTIRVVAPPSLKDLETFVLKYSICPVVKDIQIVWNQATPHPLASSYKYEHTHSLVTFNTNPEKFVTMTDSVVLLDADVFVDCRDLAFTQSVWRSSKDALVGFFPRHYRKHIRAPGSDKDTYAYLGLGNVVWTGQYSIMLSSGVVLKKQYLEEMEKSAVVRELLLRHPQCYDLAVPFFARHLKAPAPIFVDIDVDIHSGVQLSSYASVVDNLATLSGVKSPLQIGANPAHHQVKLTDHQRGECITHLMEGLSIDLMPVAEMKSVKAKEQWIW